MRRALEAEAEGRPLTAAEAHALQAEREYALGAVRDAQKNAAFHEMVVTLAEREKRGIARTRAIVFVVWGVLAFLGWLWLG